MTIPAFGLGTFRLKDDVVIASVKTALELGYRAVDTAQIYDNEVAVGQAIAESGVPRNELYITTKIWIENLSKDKLIPSLKESLKKLRTDYVDLTLIHWPSPGDAVSVEEFMQALLEAKKQGLTREIGISNFTIPLMEKAIAAVGVDNIATNQITRLHDFRFCGGHFLQYLLHAPEISLSFFSQAQLSCRTIKQTDAELHLQLFNCPADSGIGLSKLLCRPAEAAAFHDSDKNCEFFGGGFHFCSCSKIKLIFWLFLSLKHPGILRVI